MLSKNAKLKGNVIDIKIIQAKCIRFQAKSHGFPGCNTGMYESKKTMYLKNCFKKLNQSLLCFDIELICGLNLLLGFVLK